MNILLFTVDDMNQDVVAAFGGRFGPATPNLNQFAQGAYCFQHAHVAVAVCLPSRSSFITGRYPIHHGSEGFTAIHPHVPTLPEVMKDHGYFTGILGKVTHFCPPTKLGWDYQIDYEELGKGRDPQRYAEEISSFLERRGDQPFFLIVNSHDPHRPFHGSQQEVERFSDEQRNSIPVPSRIIGEEEVQVPGFLPDLPEVRKEVAEYATSCRRADDSFGAALEVLEAKGVREETIIIFTTDHGMPFPFAKTNCYRQSTRTPLIVDWPGVTKPNFDQEHMVSGVDLMPTVLEGLGIEMPELDQEVLMPPTEKKRDSWRQVPSQATGRSFFPILCGQSQVGRDHVFTVFHASHAWNRYEMRAIHTREWGYIYNAWSNGWKEFRNESRSGRTFAAMQDAAKADPEIAARVELFLSRVPEELYEYATDPDSLSNKVADREAIDQRDCLRSMLLEWMRANGDYLDEAFEQFIQST